MDRLRFATVWLGGCSGCHMSFLDLDEWLLELAARADLVYSPIIDVKEYPEGVDFVLVEGAVANEENLEMIRKVRARTKVLVSFGDGLEKQLDGESWETRSLCRLDHPVDETAHAIDRFSSAPHGIPGLQTTRRHRTLGIKGHCRLRLAS
jgi:hypothetical protein